MIILFHWAYAMATSLFTSIFQRQHTKVNETVTAQHLSETTEAQEPIERRMCAQLDTANAVEVCLLLPDIEDSTDTREAIPLESRFESDEGLRFSPPVYCQRYMAVQDILKDKRWEGNVKKVVDFGCAEFGFFNYVKNLPGIQEIVTVDVDEELLKKHCCRAAPLNSDYLSTRDHPLSVRVYAGSIAKPDHRLLGTDAVVCIEIIEHLWPDEVEAVPNNVFGFIQPLLAIFTTPNSDFNVLFPNFSGFRHWDHKFEWSREEFHCWATNIVTRYPAYEVSFHGVGAGPPGTEKYGHCSQMALFVRRPDHSNTLIQEQVVGGEEMKLVSEYIYPHRLDERTDTEKICNEAEYQLRLYSYNDAYYNDNGDHEIPIQLLLPFVEKWGTSLETLRGILVDNGWEVLDLDPASPTVIYPHYNRASSYLSVDECDDSRDFPISDHQDAIVQQGTDACEDWDSEYPEASGWDPVADEWAEASDDSIWPSGRLPIATDQLNNGRHVSSLNDLKPQELLNSSASDMASAGGTAVAEHIYPNHRATSSESPDSAARTESAVHDLSRIVPASYVNEHNTRNLSPDARKQASAAASRKRAVSADSCARTSPLPAPPPAEALAGCSGEQGRDGGGMSRGESSDSSLHMNVSDGEAGGASDTSSSDTCCVDGSRSEQAMDLDVSDHGRDDSDDDSPSDRSQAGVDNLPAVRRRPQQHRNHIAFGLNNNNNNAAVVVENGDVANNNRDGEGNNVMANADDGDDVLVPEAQLLLEIDMFDDEGGDHEDVLPDQPFDLEEMEEDDENQPLIPAGPHVNPFPAWLLNLLEIMHNRGGELGGAGEPQWPVEDI